MFMVNDAPIGRGGPIPKIFLFSLLILAWAVPARSARVEPFAGYAPEVRVQAQRVVDAAGPGREKELAREVRGLRKRMYSHGILSVNVIPDLVFRRADREGWKRALGGNFRIIAEVAPLSAQMWAWMVKEDVLRLRFADFFYDLDGLTGALKAYGPALLGYAAWFLSFASAAACWFVAWTAVALFLRARPSLEADITRAVRIPLREYFSPLVAVILFLLPLAAGVGLVLVACYWMVLSVAYLRRGELMLMTTAIVLLVFLLLGGGVLHMLSRVAGDRPNDGWLGADGYIPRDWPLEPRDGVVVVGDAAPPWMVRYSRARAEMEAGNPAGAEALLTDLVESGNDLPEVRNNRGIARANRGRMTEALADFEAAVEKRPGYGPALWNAYQAYLQMFNLERARAIQPLAWDRVQRISPFHFRLSDMEAGEWLASPLPVKELFGVIARRAGSVIWEAREGDLFRTFFRPLSPRLALLFLGLVWLTSVGWKVFSMRVWVHNTCRGCGTRTLIVGIREQTDFCNMCRARVGWGIRAGEEKERRALGIRMHRNYVKASAVLVPGSGGLWSGKEIRTMLYAVLFSLSLAGVSVSLGAREAGDIVSSLQSSIVRWSSLLAGILWLAGAWWGIWSFGKMQRMLGITGDRG